MQVQSPDQEDPLEDRMATHSCILALRILWTEEPGGLVHRVAKSQTQLRWHTTHTHIAAKSLHSCLTLCDPIDGSPPGSPVPGILQARTLEWVPISFSNAWKWKVKVKLLSHVQPSATPRTAAFQAPPSMGFSRQEYWSGLPLPSLTHTLLSLIYKLWGEAQMVKLIALG